MAQSRANWEDQTNKKQSSFSKSKNDIANNIRNLPASTREPKEQTDTAKVVHSTGGLVNQALRTILQKNKDTKRRVDEI